MSECRLQSERDVAYRALCLGAVVKRSQFEMMIQNIGKLAAPDEVQQQIITEQQQEVVRLIAWLRSERLETHLSPVERELVALPLGKWSPQQLINVSWRMEALGVLLWALRALEAIPAYDTQFWPEDVLTPLEIFTPTIDMVWCAKLRPQITIMAAREQAELWHWRARTTTIQQNGVDPPPGTTFAMVIAQVARKAHANGVIPPPIDDDFPAFGCAYTDLSEEDFATANSIAIERHYTLNWLCGYSDDWDTTPTDT